MDKLHDAIDSECAYLDKASLLKYTKQDFINDILESPSSSKYTKSYLNAKTKEELLNTWCKLKNYKLVDHNKITHFPGYVPPPPADKGKKPADKGTKHTDKGTKHTGKGTKPADKGTNPVDKARPADKGQPADKGKKSYYSALMTKA